MTTYVVLADATSQVGEGNEPTVQFWGFVANVDAVNDRDAIRQAVKAHEGLTATSYVAVPARSFKPHSVTVHNEPTIKFS